MAGQGLRPDPAPGRESEATFLEVENQSFLDARIYVIWEGARSRVGVVTGKTTEVFRFQRREGQLRVEVDFVGGGGFTTDVIQIWSGEVARLVIPPTAGQ